MLIWERDDRQTCVSYNAPSDLAERYSMSDEEQLRVFASVEALADAIVKAGP
jgi:uncharacterized protein (DUF302 family)